MSHPKGYLGKICHRSKFEVRNVLKIWYEDKHFGQLGVRALDKDYRQSPLTVGATDIQPAHTLQYCSDTSVCNLAGFCIVFSVEMMVRSQQSWLFDVYYYL